ncbi:hypothetical protein SAMN04487948_11114 [Halogranum amylolyticum]|uniref:Uncharacterized protein n=1 Tax=Halogranum amylolyticum TaxID=660520 RepID=A0A1H8UGQ3_9EURY|nr:hypothetical protein SAMN04487948_11114 [Halogranum amylolyticum]
MAHEQSGDDTEQYRQAIIEALESLGSTPEEASSQKAEEADRARETEATNPGASTPHDREPPAEPPANAESDDLGGFDSK